MSDTLQEALIKSGFKTRGAADGIKPGVERSKTPGSFTQNIRGGRGAADSGLIYKRP